MFEYSREAVHGKQTFSTSCLQTVLPWWCTVFRVLKKLGKQRNSCFALSVFTETFVSFSHPMPILMTRILQFYLCSQSCHAILLYTEFQHSSRSALPHTLASFSEATGSDELLPLRELWPHRPCLNPQAAGRDRWRACKVQTDWPTSPTWCLLQEKAFIETGLWLAPQSKGMASMQLTNSNSHFSSAGSICSSITFLNKYDKPKYWGSMVGFSEVSMCSILSMATSMLLL